MRRELVSAALVAMSFAAGAGEWQFGEPIAVTAAPAAGVFHRLDSAGRQHLAVTADTVAVVWQDNRGGQPQVYAAFRSLAGSAFGNELRLSAGKTAYDPVVIALGDGRFLFGWEQDGRVWARAGRSGSLGAPLAVSEDEAAQIALAADADARTIVAAYAQRTARHPQIVTRRIELARDNRLTLSAPVAVDPAPPADEQLYPAIAVTRRGVTVAWEDRRRGHTVLLHSHAAPGKPFSPPVILNEQVRRSESGLGRGLGVTRVALAALDDARLAAAWMDKRDPFTGYDIYAALSADGGAAFGRNELVQDQFGNEIAQWHPAIAADRQGAVVIAWDDDRDDNHDIWIASKQPSGWSENACPPPACGPKQQSHPAVALDAAGRLHLVWIERETDDGPTRVLYSMARRGGEQSPR
jgi:hypothetical protein